MKRAMAGLAILLAAIGSVGAQDLTGVSVEGVRAALLTPAGGKPKGALVLLAGGDGKLGIASDGSIAKLKGNQLVRTRQAYVERGFAVLVPEGNVNIAAAVKFMEKYGPVTLVGTSRGTQRAARGVAAGARPARLVLTAGFLSKASGAGDNVISIVGSPSKLPPTLVVHHKQDGCQHTLPQGVAPFLAWAKDKADVIWLDGGSNAGDPCEAGGYHGFKGIDGQVVSAVADFAAK